MLLSKCILLQKHNIHNKITAYNISYCFIHYLLHILYFYIVTYIHIANYIDNNFT